MVWPKSSSFASIAARYVQYLVTRYGPLIAVVFDGYPTEAEKKNTKSAERIRRAGSQCSPEVIFEETTMPHISQEKFLSHDKNKLRFIQLLKAKMEMENIQVFQAEEDADRLIVTTAIAKASDFEEVFIVGEDVDLLVILNGLTDPTQNNFPISSQPSRARTGPGKVS